MACTPKLIVSPIRWNWNKITTDSSSNHNTIDVDSMNQIERSLAALQANASRTARLCEIQREQLSLAIESICALDISNRQSAARTYKPKFFLVQAKSARERRYLKILRRSKLFDAGFYLAKYPGVAAAGIDPVLHYIR